MCFRRLGSFLLKLFISDIFQFLLLSISTIVSLPFSFEIVSLSASILTSTSASALGLVLLLELTSVLVLALTSALISTFRFVYVFSIVYLSVI